MKKYVAAVILVICLMLGACSGPEEPPAARTDSLGAAVSRSDGTVLLTIDGREIPAWRYLYWLAYACQRVQERYETAELTLDWETPVSGGTLTDYVKDQALADTALYATVENWAEEYGCAEPRENGSGSARLPDLGLTTEQMEKLNRVGQMYGALFDLYCTEGSKLAPTRETLTVFGERSGAVTLERLMVPFGEDREAARDRASELFAEINGAADQAAAFSSLGSRYGDGTGIRTLLPGTDQEELMEAAQTLEEGQCSGILELKDGFSILRRLPLDTDALKEACFDEMLQTAAENSVVTTTQAYLALDPVTFAEALLAEGQSATE